MQSNSNFKENIDILQVSSLSFIIFTLFTEQIQLNIT